MANNPYTYLRGQAIPIVDFIINAHFGLHIKNDDHTAFIAALTVEDYEAMKVELYIPEAKWNIGKHRGSVNRRDLKPEASYGTLSSKEIYCQHPTTKQ